MGKQPTIQMVADRAGVSRGTVDRVLNNRSYVKTEVRERVLDAMRELGYLSPREKHLHMVEAARFRPIRLGVVLPSWTGRFKTEVCRGIAAAQEELRDFGVEVSLLECCTELPGEVIELLDRLTDWGADGIALCAVGDPAVEARIGALADAGVPVVTLNSDLPHSRRLCYVGQDYEKSGRIAGELMSKCVPPDARVLAMCGNLEFDGHRRRLDGFCSRLHEKGFQTGHIEVVETYNDYAVTRRRVLQAIARTPDLAAVYMANRSVTGCCEAIGAAGKTGLIRVIAHDVSESTKRLLREGRLDLTISQDLYGQGYQPLMLLREMLQKGKTPAQTPALGAMSIVCAENV